MQTFSFTRVNTAAAALDRTMVDGCRFLGGGTNLVDLMREGVERPTALVDVTGLPSAIEVRDDRSLLIGGAARNTALAENDTVRRHFPMLSRAILSGASGQIRNMATVAGNMLQRTRCAYFYDDTARCNKRQRGQGCDALEGFNRGHAILGVSDSCLAVHPSDMCVALAALEAIIHVEGPAGPRTIAMADFHRLPGETPDVETTLEPGEIITAIELPPPSNAPSTYRKVRDRASYAFALVSVAAQVEVAEGRFGRVRLAIGGVSHRPWRATVAEAALEGRPAARAIVEEAVAAELAKAQPTEQNAFKVELARSLIVSTVVELGDIQ